VSASSRLAPRCGTRTSTREPRSSDSQSVYSSGSSGSAGTRTDFGTPSGGASYRPSRMSPTSWPGPRASTLSTTHPLAAHDPALADEEDLDGGLQVVLGDADDVEVLVAVGHHLLALDGLAHRGQPVPDPGRQLVLQAVGRGLHLLLEATDHGVGVAV